MFDLRQFFAKQLPPGNVQHLHVQFQPEGRFADLCRLTGSHWQCELTLGYVLLATVARFCLRLLQALWRERYGSTMKPLNNTVLSDIFTFPFGFPVCSIHAKTTWSSKREWTVLYAIGGFGQTASYFYYLWIDIVYLSCHLHATP